MHEDIRKYVRLKSSFPVDFSIVRLQGDLPGIDWQQATTQNISQEGVCLETSNLTEPIIKYFRDQNVYLDLRMKIPPDKPYIRAVCDVMWYKVEGRETLPRIIMGLKFRSVQKSELERVLWHARLFKFYSNLGVAICVIISVVLLFFGIKYYLGH